MELLLFTAVAVVLYLVADRLLGLLERKRGRPFGNRTVVFFLLLLGLALPTFALIRSLLAP